jgi:hypothetical protein
MWAFHCGPDDKERCVRNLGICHKYLWYFGYRNPVEYLQCENGARRVSLWDNKRMGGIQFVTDDKGRKVGVLIDLKNTGPFGKTSGTVSFRSRAAKKKAFLTNNIAQTA